VVDSLGVAGYFDNPGKVVVTDTATAVQALGALAHETRLAIYRMLVEQSGTWSMPNPAGADGLPAIGELAAADRIAIGVPDVLGVDRDVYAGRTTAVIGGGHSALNALIELAELREAAPGTRILWIMRKNRVEAAFGGEGADALAQRGALGTQSRALVESGAVDVVTPFLITAISRTGDDVNGRRGAGGSARHADCRADR
jgi:DNA-binding transcriptional ArsR family regulator